MPPLVHLMPKGSGTSSSSSQYFPFFLHQLYIFIAKAEPLTTLIPPKSTSLDSTPAECWSCFQKPHGYHHVSAAYSQFTMSRINFNLFQLPYLLMFSSPPLLHSYKTSSFSYITQVPLIKTTERSLTQAFPLHPSLF